MSSNAHEGILERMAEAVVQFDEEHVDAICAEALGCELCGLCSVNEIDIHL